MSEFKKYKKIISKTVAIATVFYNFQMYDKDIKKKGVIKNENCKKGRNNC